MPERGVVTFADLAEPAIPRRVVTGPAVLLAAGVIRTLAVPVGPTFGDEKKWSGGPVASPSAPPNKWSSHMISQPVLGAIAAHTQAVERGEVECRLERCPRCGQPSSGFKCHAWRRRWFHVIIDRMVKPVRSAVTRWKCVDCEKTFTGYPDFALPYKRYVRQDLCRFSERYVFDDGLSYRKAVQTCDMPVFYGAAEDASDLIDERTLSHSTLHRWIGFLGGLKQTLAQAWQLIRAKSPNCDLFRDRVAVPLWKYRSEPRRDLLHRCGRLLHADRAYRHLFEISIFTHLATVCRWR